DCAAEPGLHSRYRRIGPYATATPRRTEAEKKSCSMIGPLGGKINRPGPHTGSAPIADRNCKAKWHCAYAKQYHVCIASAFLLGLKSSPGTETPAHSVGGSHGEARAAQGAERQDRKQERQQEWKWPPARHRAAEDHHDDRYARDSGARRQGGAARRLFRRRRRRACHRNRVLAGSHRSDGERRLQTDGARVQGTG